MQDKKFPGPLEAIMVILIVFGIIVSATLMFTLLLLLTDQMSEDLSSAKYFYVLGAIPYIVLPFLYARFRKYDTVTLFRLKPVSSTTVTLSILIGIGMSVVGDELDRLFQMVIPLPEYFSEIMTSMVAHSATDWVLLLVGVVLFAAISEELVFRGFLQVTLEKQGDVTKAVLMSSLAWALIHLNPYWVVQIFIMGVIIGFMAWRTGSVLPGMIVHAVNNFISLLFINYETDLEWYTMGDHVSPVIFLVCLGILVISIRKLSDYHRALIEANSEE